MAIVFDEGYTLGREARVRLWLRALADPPGFARRWQPPAIELIQWDVLPVPRPDQVDTRAELFAPNTLKWFWPFAREEPHGHPPFYAILGLVGDALTPWRGDLGRARLGPMILFAATAGAVWTFLARRCGNWAAAAGAGAWVLQPNLFGHAHYASYDAPLASLWVLAVLAFAKAVEPGADRPRWGWTVAFGVLVGAAAATKLTGWFLPLPFAAWSVLYRDRRGLMALAAGGVAAIVSIYVFIPPWWPDPIGGFAEFVRSNLTRAETRPITVHYLGRVYNTPAESLPWHNTIVWTALVTPVGFLLLAIVGTGRAAWRWKTDRFGVLVGLNWACLLALRAMPHTPGHDGVRLFLPAFGCLAVLAGLGAAAVTGRWGRALVTLALVEGAASVAVMMPVPLSYYGPLAGGLPGAARLGMEPTYYWDAMSDDALDWLNANTGPGEKVKFCSEPTSWVELRRSRRLRPGVYEFEPGVYRWYVIQNRPGALRPMDRAILRDGRPAYVVSKLGVPLVWIYPYDYVNQWRQAGASP